jgi:Flp pilus assembly protein TadD
MTGRGSNRRFRKLKVRLPGLMVLGLLLSGCASGTHQDYSYSDQRQADAAFQKGADRPPTAATLYAMARILAAQGKDGESRVVLSRVIQRHPHFMPSYCDLAELHLRHHRVDDAMESLRAGLRVSPEDPVLLNDLGMCWLLKRDYEQALNAFGQAAAISPYNARYRANMAFAAGMLGRYEETLSLYYQVMPEEDAHYNLGVICEARKDFERATAEFRQAELCADDD